MSELYEKITSERGSLENIMASIPGFRGYFEKQARRTADRMLREYIVGQLDNRLQRYVQIEKKILDSTGLKYMDRTRDVKTKLETYRNNVNTAAPPYDGMFAQIKVTEDDLDKIYAFDEAQLRYVFQFDEVLDSLEKAVGAEDAEALGTMLDTVYNVAVEATEAFKLRDDLIVNMGDDY